jgi:hypothetical protein
MLTVAVMLVDGPLALLVGLTPGLVGRLLPLLLLVLLFLGVYLLQKLVYLLL